MESNYIQRRADFDRAQTVLTNSERTLDGLKAKSVDLAARHDAASAALVAARSERAAQPNLVHLTTKVAAALGLVEAYQDASEDNLRRLEQAFEAVTQARRALAVAEQALAPLQAEHDQAMQAAHLERREAFEKALPAARKLVNLFGADAPEAFAAIVRANCENPLPLTFKEPTGLFAQIAAAQQAPAPVNLMQLMHPVTLKR